MSDLLKEKSSGRYTHLTSDVMLSLELQETLLSDFINSVKQITLRYLFSQDGVIVDMVTNSEKPSPFNNHIYIALKQFDKFVFLHQKGYNTLDSLELGLQTYNDFPDGEQIEYYHAEEAGNYLLKELLLMKFGVEDVDTLISLGHLVPSVPIESGKTFYSGAINENMVHLDYSKLNRFSNEVLPLINYGERDFSEIEKDLRNFHLTHTYKVN